MVGNEPDSKLEPLTYNSTDLGISPRDIDQDALKIIHRLQHSGYKAYIVGGGVRDLLIESKPKDFDIVTNATPKELRKIFRNSRIIGKRFQLVHVYFRGYKIIEVSTFRDQEPFEDQVKSKGESSERGHSDNFFGTEMTDAQRRDITINALFFDPVARSIIDYVGGIGDIQSGIIRMIGEPNRRISEDPVRLIRVIRHSVRSKFKIESSCWSALKKNSHLITQSSPVRVFEEVKKDILSGHFFEILQRLNESLLLQHLIPLLSETSGVLEKNTLLGKALSRIDRAHRLGHKVPVSVSLSAICFFLKSPKMQTVECSRRFRSEVDIEEFVNTVFKKLAVPRREREKVITLMRNWLDFERKSEKKKSFSPSFSKEIINELRLLLDVCGSLDSLNLLPPPIRLPGTRAISTKLNRKGYARKR